MKIGEASGADGMTRKCGGKVVSREKEMAFKKSLWNMCNVQSVNWRMIKTSNADSVTVEMLRYDGAVMSKEREFLC